MTPNPELNNLVSSLPSAVSRLQSPVCSLRSAVFGLQSAVFSLQSSSPIPRATISTFQRVTIPTFSDLPLAATIYILGQ
jgi:hypothetical protein